MVRFSCLNDNQMRDRVGASTLKIFNLSECEGTLTVSIWLGTECSGWFDTGKEEVFVEDSKTG